ncbi:glycosyltransferase [Nocardioides sp. TF02-7]|uniref:glycosyltransferase n=1 Tax=Nocardioides sp. TF02-7 TaxID=2917724 RepID=UPI001F0602D6|nr:glycosyltransferase [Nocardioides sp. TF02-7]UMG91534.1 glycosyltransferase [Nocardioides sp. TF02-7]
MPDPSSLSSPSSPSAVPSAARDRGPAVRQVVVASLMRETGGTGVQSHVSTLLAQLQPEPPADPHSHSAVTLVTPFSSRSPLLGPVFAGRFLVRPVTRAGAVWWYRHWHAEFLAAPLRSALQARPGAVVYAQCPVSAAVALRVRRPGQPVVLAAHFNVSQADEWADKGEIRRGGRCFRAIRALEDEVVPRLDGIVYVSDFARRTVEQRIPAARQVDAVVVPNPVVVPPEPPGRRATRRGDLVTVGSLEPRKNQGYLLDVLHQLARRGTRPSLTVVGEGPDRAALVRRARDLELSDQVRFLGHTDDVPRVLAEHRVYCHAARMESFGIAVAEAMAAGLPVVAAPVGGLAELVEPGRTGELWPLDDPAAAADVLERVLARAQVAGPEGRDGRRRLGGRPRQVRRTRRVRPDPRVSPRSPEHVRVGRCGPARRAVAVRHPTSHPHESPRRTVGAMLVTGLTVAVLGATACLAPDGGVVDQADGVSAEPATAPVDVPNRGVRPDRRCGTAELRGPRRPPSGARRVRPTQDVARLAQTAPPGTTFWLAPGVHRFDGGEFSQIIPKRNQTFIGAPGAVIDGQRHHRYAFGGQAPDVTIAYLTIRRFGARRGNHNEGVVNHDAAPGWAVRNSTIVANAGAGVMLGSRNRLLGNCLKNNGQYGFSAYHPDGVRRVTVRRNEIVGNNTDDWENRYPGCGCTGGGKFWATSEGRVVRNWVHHNRGVGLWADTNNTGFLFEANVIDRNDAKGIIYETSYNARFVANTFSRNGWVDGPDDPGFPTPALYISESGGDSRVRGSYRGELSVLRNRFVNNWSAVVGWGERRPVRRLAGQHEHGELDPREPVGRHRRGLQRPRPHRPRALHRRLPVEDPAPTGQGEPVPARPVRDRPCLHGLQRLRLRRAVLQLGHVPAVVAVPGPDRGARDHLRPGQPLVEEPLRRPVVVHGARAGQPRRVGPVAVLPLPAGRRVGAVPLILPPVADRRGAGHDDHAQQRAAHDVAQPVRRLQHERHRHHHHDDAGAEPCPPAGARQGQAAEHDQQDRDVPGRVAPAGVHAVRVGAVEDLLGDPGRHGGHQDRGAQHDEGPHRPRPQRRPPDQERRPGDHVERLEPVDDLARAVLRGCSTCRRGGRAPSRRHRRPGRRRSPPGP